MKLGRFEIDTFVEQHFRLDGGMMFGVVPKTLWQRSLAADENNLIPMVNNLFVVTADGKRMIFDVGLGDTLTDREKKVYGTDGVTSIEEGLAGLGLSAGDIDYVILTHLHTDHSGGVVAVHEGEHALRFPNARYIATKEEWQVAMHPNERTAAVYAPDRLRPLMESGRLELIDANTELFPGIRAVHTGGHTEGHFALEIESEGKKLFYYADIFPSTHHMRLPYIAATDIHPLRTLEVKKHILPKIVSERVILAYDHDIGIPFGIVSEKDGRITVRPATAEVSTT